MRKFISVLLILSVMIPLSGCAKGLPDDEAAAVVAELVEASLELNVIYFGDGMPAEADGDEHYVGFYSRLTDAAPYLTEKELRQATLEVFTEAYASVIFQTYLVGINDSESEGTVYARYVENGDRLTKKTDYEPLAPKVRTYDLENIKIMRSAPEYITATLQSFVEGKADAEVTVTLRLEERERETAETEDNDNAAETELVWRLDSPTY